MIATETVTTIKNRIKINRSETVMDFKTIYLLTDFSDHARNACVYAIKAFGPNVNYALINSYIIRGGAATLIDLEQIAFQESVDNLRNEKEELAALFPEDQLDIELISKSGFPADVINDLNKDFRTDLVVVGSKGISKLDDFLIGSVTNAIIRGVELPVLAVPLNAKYTQMERVVLASDLNNVERPAVVETVSKLKRTFESNVCAATVQMEEGGFSTKESKQFDRLRDLEIIDDAFVIQEIDAAKGLMEHCKNTNADLLVVVAKHTSLFKRFFHKSITKELVNHEVLPILVLEDN